MSDTSTPAPTPTKKSAASGSGLQHRLGPLPVWGWVVVAIGAIIIYKIIKSRSAAASSTTGGTVPVGNNANSLFGTEGFSTNSAGQVVDNATGDILGGGEVGAGGTTGSAGTQTFAQWESQVQQTLFGLGYDSSSVDQALQDYAAGSALPANEFGIIEAGIRLTGNPPTGIGLPQELAPAAPPASGGSAPSTPAASALAEIDASAWPEIVKFGQDANAATDFTQIGTVTGGKYQGPQVADGAPVYAGVLGGYAQGTNFSTLPDGTAIYIPTALYKQGYASQAA